MGDTQAAIVVACLLQRSSAIQSAGGYLRELTRKAGQGSFRSVRFSWRRSMRERASEERPKQVFSCRAGALPASRFSRTVLRYGVRSLSRTGWLSTFSKPY